MLDLNQYAHSLDQLEIVHHAHLSCVRKTFRSDLGRAERNVAKQRHFRPLYTGLARVAAAEVLDFSIHEDRAELLMPYVEGMTGHMFPVHATRHIGHTLSMSLSTLLYAELNDSREELISLSLFRSKLDAVAKSTDDGDLRALVVHASDQLASLPAQLPFPIGSCHGDLTLSNVILDPVAGVTLIDFLDTYLETPLQDVAKLKQDFVYGWSFRKEAASLGIKAEILCRYHFPRAITQIERMYPRQVWLMTVMALARIAPYVRDITTKQWLVNSLTHCMKA